MKSSTKFFSEETQHKINEAKNYIKSINLVETFVVFYIYIGGIYGLSYLITGKAKLFTYIWGWLLNIVKNFKN